MNAPDRPRSTARLGDGPRRLWPGAVIVPIVFGVLQLLVLASCIGEDLAPWHGSLTAAATVAKLASIPCLPFLAMLLAERIGERPERWRQAFAAWAGIGVAVVLAVARVTEPIAEATSSAAYLRLWPTGQAPPPEVAALGYEPPNWTVERVLTYELVTVVVIAAVAALVLWASARVPAAALLALPVAVVATLATYASIAGWPLRPDYDFFVGDAVLGATLGELVFFFGPFDPVGSAAIGLASLSMGGLLAAWGGPRSATRPDPAPTAVPVASAA